MGVNMQNSNNLDILRKMSFKIAYTITKNPDDAEDIAQLALYKFISAKDIQNAEAWIAKVTYNLSKEMHRIFKKNDTLFQNLKNPICQFHKSSTPLPKKEKLPQLSLNKIKKYLSSEELTTYKQFLQCGNSVSKYAKQFHLTYNQANKRVTIMRRNLKAGYLFEKGIKNSDVLTYQQWHNIYKIINRKLVKNTTNGFGLDEYLELGFLRKAHLHHIVVIGKKQNLPAFIVMNVIFHQHRVTLKEIKAPSLVKKVSFADSLLISKGDVSDKSIDLNELKNNDKIVLK